MAAKTDFKRPSTGHQVIRVSSPKPTLALKLPTQKISAVPKKPKGDEKPKAMSPRPMTSEQYKTFLTQQLARLKLGQNSPTRTPRVANQTFQCATQRMDWKNGLLSDYEIGKILGQGAYAVVRSAVHRPSRTSVALKTYEKFKLLDPHRKQGVHREIRVLSLMTHPHIVRLREVIECPNQLHLVMDLVPGLPLYRFLRQQPGHRLPDALARSVFHQIVSAIAYCHGLAISHRDIKLENMLLDSNLNVRVIDFGFATHGEKLSKLFCGTPSYMAPEIVTRREYSGCKADVWALGVLLFALICGELPFKGKSDRELYSRIQRGVYRIPDYVSPGAKAVIQSALVKNPDERPTASSLLSNPWVAGSIEPRSSGVELYPVQPKVLSTHSSTLGAGCDSSETAFIYLSTG